jgi:hypothetical protein
LSAISVYFNGFNLKLLGAAALANSPVLKVETKQRLKSKS